MIGVVGLGYWGPNLARNFDELGDALAGSAISTEELRASSRRAIRSARRPTTSTSCSPTTTLEAVVIATPVPTHYELAKQALEAGKHVFVEKPPAMRAAEMDELVALAAERDLVLMPGHLLLYHPGVLKLKELIDAGELGDVLCVYGNRQNLGIVRTNENALWSLGVHDLSVILYLLDEEPEEAVAHGNALPHAGRRGRRLLLPALPERQDRAHAPLVARPAQDAADDRRRPREDGRLRRHGARAQGDGVREGAVEARRDLRRVADAHRRHLDPEDPDRRAAAARVPALPRAGRRRGRPAQGRRGRRAVVRALEQADARRSSMAEIHPTAIVYPGTVLGEGVKVLEGAVVGKQPTLSPRSTAKREPLPPAELGDGTIVSTGAIVFAGSTIGARVILGDQSCVRERVHDRRRRRRRPRLADRERHDDRRGTKIQADAYITAYSTLEEDVFIAPCVVTTNDNFMGRTEQRHGLMQGPTIRRGARIGGGAILCPGVEIGEEAFVGAGAVVTKDVPPRMLVVGNPARVLRDVPDDELLENQ